MNGNCKTCDVEDQCAYEYKPCDCCNYRKFKMKVVVPELTEKPSTVNTELDNQEQK